jgi:hypothetical protein
LISENEKNVTATMTTTSRNSFVANVRTQAPRQLRRDPTSTPRLSALKAPRAIDGSTSILLVASLSPFREPE